MRATVTNSPLIPEAEAVEIFYREAGQGTPLLYLHSGWGYAIYPFDSQIAAFDRDFRILIPDRSGHGRSRRMKELPIDYHRRAAGEMIGFLDALEIDSPILWGHSDGAVVAAWMALEHPERFRGVILESLHFYRSKPLSSAELLAQLAENPDRIGARTSAVLAADHGEDYWRDLIAANSRAWLQIGETAPHSKADLYGGRLSELRVPTLLIHGSRDPRGEPGELESVQRDCPQGRMHIIEGCGHSPHAEKESFEECNTVAGEFLRELGLSSHR